MRFWTYQRMKVRGGSWVTPSQRSAGWVSVAGSSHGDGTGVPAGTGTPPGRGSCVGPAVVLQRMREAHQTPEVARPGLGASLH